MRRTVGQILIMLGAFCLAFAPMLKFYVAHEVIAAPTGDFWLRTELRATNASYFDSSKGKVRTGVELIATNTTRGDAQSSTDKIAVWDAFISFRDPDSGQDVQIQGRRMAFDRRTGELVMCCGASVDQDTSVKQTGLGLMWPLADVEKRTYPYFDQTTKRAWPMVYSGEETVRGTTTYKFVETIPETFIGALPGNLPPQILGLNKKKPGVKLDKNGNAQVDEYFSSVLTMWVDPRTGIPVAQQEKIKATGYTKDHKGSVVLTDADLKTTDADQKSLVGLADSNAWKFAMVRDWGPIGALIFGLFLLVSGIFLPYFDKDRPRRVKSLGAIPMKVELPKQPTSGTRSSPESSRPAHRGRISK
jgi:hypothetical protein